MANLEGMRMKFMVMKLADVNHLTEGEQMKLSSILNKIEEGRKAEGKKENKYLVINTDEQYTDEVIEIMKRHGHWE